ncbi:transposable element Tcb1 transposase [Trichonephila clavipes]|nr:transposable element Tcb1 transposase [Trichonephila clavipes]
MPLRRFREQYDQLSQFERGRTIGMLEAGWSASQVARQLDRSGCVVRRRWDQWIREMSFTRRPGSGRPRPTSTGSTFTRGPCSSRAIRRCLAEGHLGSRRPLRVLPLTPTHRRLRLEWCRARGNWTAAELNQVVFSYVFRFNLNSDDNRVRVWRSRSERLNPAFALQRYTVPTAGVMVWADIAYDTRSHFSTRQCSALHGKGDTRLSPHCYYPSLACVIPGFVSNQAYLGLFGMATWAFSEFEPTRSKVTANVERNAPRHHTELVSPMPNRVRGG